MSSFKPFNFFILLMMTLSLFVFGQVAFCLGEKPFELTSIQQNEIEKNIPIERIATDKELPAITLFLRLKKVIDAKNYEIQIRPKNRSWAVPQLIKTDREKLRLRVSPGSYEIRTRSLDASNKRGVWLAWKPFYVPFKILTDISPKPKAVIQPKGEIDELITFEWPRVKKAKGYRFKLYDSNHNLIRHLITSNAWATSKVKIQQSYLWSVRPLLNLNEPENEALEKTHSFSVSEPENELTPLTLKLTKNPLADKYQFELVKILNKDEESEPTTYESRESVFKARLSPGDYQLRVRTLYVNGAKTGWGRPTAFTINIPSPQLITPINGKIIEPSDDLENEVDLNWTSSKWADRYQIFVYDSQMHLIVNTFTKDTHLAVKLKHNEKYQWKVKAYFPNEKPRKIASNEDLKNSQMGDFAIAEYVKLDLATSEEPSQLYAWTRGMISNVSYTAENYDNLNRVKQSMIASTVELAGGYWHRKTNIGLLGTASISGVQVGGVRSTFNQYSALLGFRKNHDGNLRSRLWVGVSQKETPEVLVNGSDNQLAIKNIKTLGPIVLASIADSLTNPWGYQGNLGIFYGLQNQGSPNGLPQDKYFSYFGSGYLTYKWSADLTAMFGYTYQADEAGYRSSDRSGNDNHVSYSGHYFSVNLLMGLEKPQK